MFNYIFNYNVFKNSKIHYFIRRKQNYTTYNINYNLLKYCEPCDYDYGYVYCISNVSMPGILKIGMTKRNPLIRLKEANYSDTWRPPTPYNIEFYINVYNPKYIENEIHRILQEENRKIHKKREFFHLNIIEAKHIFNMYNIPIYVN